MNTELSSLDNRTLPAPLYIVQFFDQLAHRWDTHMYSYDLQQAKDAAHLLMLEEFDQTRVVASVETYHVIEEYNKYSHE